MPKLIALSDLGLRGGFVCHHFTSLLKVIEDHWESGAFPDQQDTNNHEDRGEEDQ